MARNITNSVTVRVWSSVARQRVDASLTVKLGGLGQISGIQSFISLSAQRRWKTLTKSTKWNYNWSVSHGLVPIHFQLRSRYCNMYCVTLRHILCALGYWSAVRWYTYKVQVSRGILFFYDKVQRSYACWLHGWRGQTRVFIVTIDIINTCLWAEII